LIKPFINIRLKQLNRELTGIGLFRVLFLFGLLCFLGYIMFMKSSLLPNVYYVLGIYFLMLSVVHLNRPDKKFLKIHFDNFKLFYLTEYFLLSIPLIFCLVYFAHWIPLAIWLFSLLVLINLDIQTKSRSRNTKIQDWIPNGSFEWKGGIRKILFVIVPVWVIALATSFFKGSVPIALFILGLIPLSFYEKSEPWQMIITFEKSSGQFLWYKVKTQLILFSVITLPLILAFIIFHSDLWYIAVVEYFVFIFLHIYLIMTKYAFYEPNIKSPATATLGAIGAIFSIIPVFIPVVWLMSIWFYFKSISKLKFYLDDFNS